MARIAGTDVWRWSTALSANWRGSYCFIPTERDDVLPLLRRAKQRPNRNALRERLATAITANAIADPLEFAKLAGGRSCGFSATNAGCAPSAGMGSS